MRAAVPLAAPSSSAAWELRNATPAQPKALYLLKKCIAMSEEQLEGPTSIRCTAGEDLQPCHTLISPLRDFRAPLE